VATKQKNPWILFIGLSLLLLPLLLVHTGCSKNSSKGGTSDFIGTPGVQITEVAIFQGPKRTLASQGEPVSSEVPLIVGRDALIRVYYTLSDEYNGQEVVGRLNLNDNEPIEVAAILSGDSSESNIESTINFELDGDLIGESLTYSLEIVQDGNANNDNPNAKYPTDASGDGWQELGYELLSFRQKDNADDDAYYYAIFNPTDTFMQYCGSGCLLGVTLLNNDPPDVGSVQLRLALGVGYESYAINTCVHEIGHAHGREHAPCGPGLDPNSIDAEFPYSEGEIGVWSYDIVNGVLKSPDDFTDIMGYCNNQWISDYNYDRLHRRSQNVNMPNIEPPPSGKFEYQLVGIEGDGNTYWHPSIIEKRRPLSGLKTPVTVEINGITQTVTGQFFPYDHLPGGWLFIPSTGQQVTNTKITLDGVKTVALR